jgi:hypothetical protein
METEQSANRVTVGRKELVSDLKRVIRKGLPIAEEDDAGKYLPHLRNVASRSIDPQDIYGRLDALNYLLPKLLADIDDDQLGPTARILFGVEEGTRGTTLTVRRQRCASLLEYDLDHFRKRVELQVLQRVAQELHRDLVRYRRRLRRAVTAYETSRPTPGLLREDITHEEELLSRIWQHLYQIRAEHIATALANSEDDENRHRQERDTAARAMESLIDSYLTSYGREYISNGQLEYAIRGLERLVVWTITPRSAHRAEDQ